MNARITRAAAMVAALCCSPAEALSRVGIVSLSEQGKLTFLDTIIMLES